MKTINNETLELLRTLSQEDMFITNKAKLIGGTALAYHLNHRESFDLDICFYNNPKLPNLDFLNKYFAQEIEFNKSTVDEFINDGGNVYEYHRRFIINSVKVDFVTNVGSNIYENEILKKDNGTKFNNIDIASVESIFKLKSLLLIDRNKLRDLYDICYLIQNDYFKGGDIIDTIKNYRITYQDKDIISLIKSRAEDIVDTHGEPIINATKTIPTNYQEIKDYIIKQIEKNLNKPSSSRKYKR
ncbi:MAG: nucleotidyl transferase AbiEii/AbiGii toxin family protein [Candidatus Muirbacterium halophilum]|nr:nucleotidyl transferase AbiEii/AbiGii toxin family protein [Candidatus Muirbacterium halophilum]